MQRLKITDGRPPPDTGGNWLAGVIIGSAIMTMATQAILLGAGAAITGSAIKRG